MERTKRDPIGIQKHGIHYYMNPMRKLCSKLVYVNCIDNVMKL